MRYRSNSTRIFVIGNTGVVPVIVNSKLQNAGSGTVLEEAAANTAVASAKLALPLLTNAAAIFPVAVSCDSAIICIACDVA